MGIQPTPTGAAPFPCLTPGAPVDVTTWRFCRLCEAGFPEPLAEELSRQPVDLHVLLQLVDAGCPPVLAARILSPLGSSETPR